MKYYLKSKNRKNEVRYIPVEKNEYPLMKAGMKYCKDLTFLTEEEVINEVVEKLMEEGLVEKE